MKSSTPPTLQPLSSSDCLRENILDMIPIYINVKISHCKVTLFFISNKNNLDFVICPQKLIWFEIHLLKKHRNCHTHPSYIDTCFCQVCTHLQHSYLPGELPSSYFFTITKIHFILFLNKIKWTKGTNTNFSSQCFPNTDLLPTD